MTRIGASQAFFNIVAKFNAQSLVKDVASMNTIMKAVALDTFEAVLKPIDDMVLMIDSAIDAVKDLGIEMGDATVEFEKFYGASGDIETTKDQLLELGEAYGIVGTEALAAGSRAAQVGNLIGRQNVLLLVEQAAILSEISDLSLEEAQRGMIQLNQQAGILYGEMTRQQIMSLSAREQEIILTENSARALDVLNTVANRSVALEGDLVKTMTNFASAAHLAGDSFEFMTAASAVLLEAGEEQGTAGRALRMIYARLGGDINNSRTELERMGFVLTDASGNMKTMQEVLTELSNKGWAGLNEGTKQHIAQTVAGNRHYVRFIKLMENYDRITNLASDAQLRLDSASSQAAKALESEVRQLQDLQASVENAKAAIGEGLTPFMRGATEAELNFLEATEMLTDGLGEVGYHLGKIMGTFKVTEGFVKFGIMLQSIEVGLGIFNSVQKSLNGIEVAVANLHSKQATYLGYSVTATKEQKYLMDGIMHSQQVINRANKEIQNIKTLLVTDEEKLLNLAKQREGLSNKIGWRLERNTQFNREIRALQAGQRVEEKEGDSIYAKRAGRLEYEVKYNKELLATQKSIYMEKAGSEDAYMRQMLADFDVFGNFNEKELIALTNKNREHRKTHTLLQSLKAENEAIRSIGAARKTGIGAILNEGDLMMLQDYFADFDAGATKAIEKQKQIINKKGVTEIDKENAEARIKVINNQREGIDQLTKAVTNSEKPFFIQKEGFDSLVTMLERSAGAYYQTERGLRTYTAAEKDFQSIESRLTIVKEAQNKANKHLLDDGDALLKLDKRILAENEKLAPLMEIVTGATETRTEKTRAMKDMIQILVTEESKLTDEMKKRQKAYIKEFKNSDEMTSTLESRAAASKRLSLGLASSLSMLSGSLGGPAGAAAAMGMMVTQTGYMAANVAKAAKEVFVLNKAVMAVNFQLVATDSVMKKMVVTSAAFMRAFLPLAIVGGAMYLYAKHSEKAAKAAAELNDHTMEFEATLGRLDADTKIMSDDSLAKMLGVSGITMGDLNHDTEKTSEVMGKLKNHSFELAEGLQESVAESIQLLEVLQSMQNESALMSPSLFQENYMKGLGSLGYFSAIWDIGQDERNTMLAMYRDLGIEVNESFYESSLAMVREKSDAYLRKNFFIDMSNAMRSGYQFSADEMSKISTIFDDDINNILVAMNALVNTADMTEYNFNRLEKSAEEAGLGISDTAEEIENLTQEIYDFSGAREELFFGGKFGNVTGSLYKQVVSQGVGTLYHKNEIIMSNNFHGFFNEQEAADRIMAVLNRRVDELSGGLGD